MIKLVHIKKDKSDNKIEKEKTLLTFPAIIALLIGIFSYLSILIVKILMHYKYINKESIIWTTLNDVLINLGNVLIAVCVGSLIIEYYGFIDYMRQRIRDVLIDDDFLNILNKEKMEKLKNKLELRTLYTNINDVPDDSLYYVVQNEIKPLLKEVFFEEYIVTVDCEMEGEYIKKTMNRRMVFSSLNKNEEIPIFLLDKEPCMSLKSIKGKTNEELFRINKFEFNKQDYTNVVNSIIEKGLDEIYDIDVALNMENVKGLIVLKNGKGILETEYISYSPLEDTSFTHRVSRPCKNYCIHFNYNKSIFDVKGEGFGFMDSSPNERVIRKYFSNSIVIRFVDWILPGDGVLFIVKTKM